MPSRSTVTTDVVIVGAGLAGLRCTQVLRAAGLQVDVIDQRAEVGGRLASSTVDGYVLDEGFQLINPGYPELRATGVLNDFDLRSFDPAIAFHQGGRTVTVADPRVHPWEMLETFVRGDVPRSQLLRFGGVLARCALTPVARLRREPDGDAAAMLRARGLGGPLMDDVLRPFLRGTVLDDELNVSWHYVQLLLKSFTRGRPGTHPEGVVALARAMARRAPGATFHLNEHVTRVTDEGAWSAERAYRARAVVLCGDGSANAALGALPEPAWRAQTTWWWSTPQRDDSAQLRIDRDEPRLTSALDLTSRAPERAPRGRSLIATPAIGVVDSSVQHAARASVARLYGLDEREVELVERTVVARALPVVATPLDLAPPIEVGGLFIAGDARQTPSIQGALVSGRRAAYAVLNRLGVPGRAVNG